MTKPSLGCSVDRRRVLQDVYRNAEQRFITGSLTVLDLLEKEYS